MGFSPTETPIQAFSRPKDVYRRVTISFDLELRAWGRNTSTLWERPAAAQRHLARRMTEYDALRWRLSASTRLAWRG